MSTLVSLYEGANGTTLRIAPETVGDLEGLTALWSELSERLVSGCDLVSRVACTLEAVAAVTLKSGLQRPGKSVELERTSDGGFHVFWINDREGWLDCLERARALLDLGRPGHHYLSRERGDDALIELSFLE